MFVHEIEREGLEARMGIAGTFDTRHEAELWTSKLKYEALFVSWHDLANTNNTRTDNQRLDINNSKDQGPLRL